MRRKRKDEYHLLVAQNFLGNISLTGRHDDTKLRLFNSAGLKEECPGPCSESWFEKSDLLPLEIAATVPELNPKRSLPSPVEQDEDPFSQSYPSFTRRHKKPPSSLFRRLVKILSSDQIIQSRESRLDREHVQLTSRSNKDGRRSRRESIRSGSRPQSPTSESFFFFRKIRTSIARGERSYLCSSSTFAPFAVLSHFPFLSHDRHRLNRSHSTLATSTDRIRHISQCSVEELKPYEFYDDVSLIDFQLDQPICHEKLPLHRCYNAKHRSREVEISFGFLFGRRRGVSPCGAILSARRSERRDSNYVESMTKLTDPEASDTLGTMVSLLTKDPSYEPDEIEWDEPSGEIYSPILFEEIEHSRRTVIRNTGYIGVTLQYSSKDTVKSTMNQAFAEKFPRVNLTYSKFKSIIAEMISLCRQCNIDLSATAQSIIYFERIVHKALISKSNRKVVGGASILVSLKLNDYSKEHIKEFIETATDKLRISRKELLALEIPLCAALHFKLQASAEHVAMHYDRLLIAS